MNPSDDKFNLFELETKWQIDLTLAMNAKT